MAWLLEEPARLDGYRRGDVEMLTAAYLHYAPRLARAVTGGFVRGERRFVLTSPFEVDDLVQETFLRAFAPAARASYDGVRPFFGYLSAIARNLIIDRGRRERRRPQEVQLQTLGGEPGGAASPSPESAAMVEQLRHLYRGFVDDLAPIDRMVWVMRVEQESPRRVVEEATGSSAMQVRTRETKLRRELLRRLDAAGYGAELERLGLSTLLGLIL